MEQIIIHVDMDAFYASVEIRDNPSLKGKPLIIGSLPNERGVVATCSYEARKYGVHSAMNIKEAYRLCPNGVYMHPDFNKYKTVSEQLHKIWKTYSSELEAIALDEAYLDVTKQAADIEGARKIAQIIKQRTKKELGLNCSIGVAYSKVAAKTASEEDKPDGYFEIPTAEDFVNLIIDRDVSVIYSVGKKTAEKLYSIGIKTVRNVRERKEEVINLLGKQGKLITEIAYGKDDRKVITYRPQDAKSISREVTFQKDVKNYSLLKDVLFLLALCIEHRAKKLGLYGNGITLKITYYNMKSITRSKRISSNACAVTIYKETIKMLDLIEKHPVRLVGAGIYNLSDKEEKNQFYMNELFEEQETKYNVELKEMFGALQKKYRLDFENNVDKIYQNDTLHKTIEYMHKHIK